MSKDTDDKFSAEETQRRIEAALRGARITGHKTMKEISPKRERAAKTKKKEANSIKRFRG